MAEPPLRSAEALPFLTPMMKTEAQTLRYSLYGEGGQSLVEFAVVLPLLSLLLLGILQFGVAFHNYLSITDAARVGAREGAVNLASQPCDKATNKVNGLSIPPGSTVSCTTPDGLVTGKRLVVTISAPTFTIRLPGLSRTFTLTTTATERLE